MATKRYGRITLTDDEKKQAKKSVDTSGASSSNSSGSTTKSTASATKSSGTSTAKRTGRIVLTDQERATARKVLGDDAAQHLAARATVTSRYSDSVSNARKAAAAIGAPTIERDPVSRLTSVSPAKSYSDYEEFLAKFRSEDAATARRQTAAQQMADAKQARKDASSAAKAQYATMQYGATAMKAAATQRYVDSTQAERAAQAQYDRAKTTYDEAGSVLSEIQTARRQAELGKMDLTELDRQIEQAQAEVNRLKYDGMISEYTGQSTTYAGQPGGSAELKEAQSRLKELKATREEAAALQYQRRTAAGYALIPRQKDYAENAEADESVDDPFYQYINGGRLSVTSAGLGVAANYEKYSQMTDEERGTYNYIYRTRGAKQARQYLEDIEYSLNQRRMNKVLYGERDEQGNVISTGVAGAAETPAGAILLSAASVPLNLTSSIGAIDLAVQRLERAITGSDKPLDYNTTAQLPGRISSTVRGTVSRELNDWSGTVDDDVFMLGGWGAGTLYQTAMSVLDSAAGAATFGTGTAILLGGSAAQQAMQDAHERGATDSQAVSFGILSGVFEAMFEYVSLDKLIKIREAGNARELFRNVLKQSGIEASEEFCTTLANVLISEPQLQDLSQFSQKVEEYKALGYSDSDARKQASMDMFSGMMSDALAGFLSGAPSAGGATVIRGAQAATIGRSVQQAGVYDALLEAALADVDETGRPTEANLFAQRIKNGEIRANNTNKGTLAALFGTERLEELTSLEEEAPAEAAESPTTDETEQETTGTPRPVRASTEAEQAARQQNRGARLAATLGHRGAQAFRETYTQNMSQDIDADTAARGFAGFYDAKISEHAELSQETLTAMAEVERVAPSLRIAAQSAAEFDMDQQAQTKFWGEKSGIEGLARMSEATEEQKKTIRQAQKKFGYRSVRVLDALGRATGTRIQFDDQISADNGQAANAYYDASDSTIHVSLQATDPIQAVITHEVVHRMRTGNIQAYRTMAQFVLDNMGEGQQSRVFNQLALRYRGAYENVGVDEVTEEMIADAFGFLIGDSEMMQRFANEHSEAHATILEHIQNLLAKVRRFLLGESRKEILTKETRRAYSDLEGRLSEMAKVMEKALRSSAEMAKTAKENTARTEGGEVRYSINPHFARNIAEWDEDGRPDGETFILGTTGDVLQGLGIRENDLYILSDKINMILDEHPEMTLDAIKRIPEILDDPILVLESNNASGVSMNTRLVLFGNVMATNNRPVMAVLDLAPVEGEIQIEDMQKVSSSYTKTVHPEQFVRKSGVLHADKKRTGALLRTIGFRMPTALLRTGSMGSIEYAGPVVKINSIKFADVVQEQGDVKRQFSLSSMVEETPDLIAVHGLTEQNLLDSLRLGGLPMPSIAIVRAEEGHTDYGEISLVFYKDTIDPQARRENRVYGADAWTPTTAQAKVEYPVDVGSRVRIEKQLKALAERVAGGVFSTDAASALGRIGLHGIETGDDLQRIARRLAQNDGVRAAFLAARGEDVTPVYKKREYNRKFGNKTLQRFLRQIDMQTLAAMNEKLDAYEHLTEDERDMVRPVLREYYREAGEALLQRMAQKRGWSEDEISRKREERIDRSMENVSPFAIEDFVRDAWSYYQAGETDSEEIDVGETSIALLNKLGSILPDGSWNGIDDSVAEWVETQLEGLLGAPGIRNDVNPYTRSGNRRSFSSTHYEYTLENVVRAMAETDERGVGMWGLGSQGLQAVTAAEYGSISEIKRDSGRLRKVDSEEYKAIQEQVEAEIASVVSDILETNRDVSYNQGDVEEVLILAARGTRTPAGIRRTFARESPLEITDAQARAVEQLFEHAAQIPTRYFEAKPRRAVGFEEVAAAVVPDTMRQSTKDQLAQRGVPYVEYTAGNDTERVEKMNSVPGVRFSITVGMTEEERYQELKDKKITVRTDIPESHESEVRSLERLQKKAKSKAEKIIYPLARELGILNKTHRTPALDIDFLFSKTGGLAESLSKQLRYGGNYADFAKALINLDTILENAVLIERHSDKYAGTVRENRNLQNTSVLLGLFKDGDDLIPVQFEIKRATDGNRLYMTVAMTKIRAGVLENAVLQDGEARSLIPTLEYNVADVFSNVNPADGHFLKYVPDGFLSEEQKSAKNAAINEDNERIGSYGPKYSLSSDSATLRTVARLQRENAQLRQRVDALRGEFQRTKKSTASRQSMMRACKSLLESSGSQLRVRDILDDMTTLYEAVIQGDNTRADELLQSLAERIVESVVITDTDYEAYAGEILHSIKGYQLTISEEDSHDIPDYNDWRRRYFGRLNIKKGPATNIDQAYSELATMYPGQFSETEHIVPVDQLLHMAEVVDQLSAPITFNMSDAEFQAGVEAMESAIMYAFPGLDRVQVVDESATRTYADRKAKEKRDAVARAQQEGETRVRAVQSELTAARESFRQQLANAEARNRDIIRQLQQNMQTRQQEQLAQVGRSIRSAAYESLQGVEDMRSVARNAEAASRLTQWRAKMDEYTAARDQLRQIRSQIRGTTGDERTRLQNNRDTVQQQVARLEAQLDQMESYEGVAAFFDATRKAERQAATRRVQQARAEQRSRDVQEREGQREKARERKETQELHQRLMKLSKRLTKMKMPSEARAVLDQLIGEYDLTAFGIRQSTLDDLTELQARYEEMKQDPNFIPNPQIEEKLKRLTRRHFSDLSMDEVRDLVDVLAHFEAAVREANRFKNSQIRIGVYEAGEQTIRDVSRAKGTTEMRALHRTFDQHIVYETLSPLRFMHRITGYNENSPLYQATQELADAQRDSFTYQMEAQRPFREYVQDKAFRRRITGRHAAELEIRGTDAAGNEMTVKVTPAMLIALHCMSQDADNLATIARGGLTVPANLRDYKLGRSNAWDQTRIIRMTPTQIGEAVSQLSDREVAFANEIFRYYNEVSAPQVARTFEDLHGYAPKMVEGGYYPKSVNKDYLASDETGVYVDNEGRVSLNPGFMQERVKSRKPILLEDANLVLNRSISRHASYVGLSTALQNFQRIWNMQLKDYAGTVKETVRSQWGKKGVDYINKMIADLSGTKAAKTGLNKAFANLRSHYASAALTLNLGVMVKQAASYPTAGSVLGFRPLARALADPTAYGKVDLDLIEKYTSLQWYRSQGYTTQEIGEMAARGTQLPPVLNWIQDMDLWTTRKLWKAAEYYVRENSPELYDSSKRGRAGTDTGQSNAYYEAVAEIYNRVIEETQPNYTTMQRPQLLRQDGELYQIAGMFKTQPFQNFNILYDAYGNLTAKQQAARDGTITQEELRQARRDAWNATWSQALQQVVFAGMTFAWALLRGKTSRYKDDDDELTVKSFLRGFGRDVASGVSGMFPFGTDVYELIYSLTTGDSYEGIESGPVSLLNDFIDSIETLNKEGRTVLEAVRDPEHDPAMQIFLNRLFYKVAPSVGALLGIPVNNVENLFKMAMYQATSNFGGLAGEYAYAKATVPFSNYSTYYDIAYRAFVAGDTELFAQIVSELVGSNYLDDKGEEKYTEEKIIEKIVSKVKSAYKAGDLTEEQIRAYMEQYPEQFLTSDLREKYDLDDAIYWRLKGWGSDTESTSAYADVKAVLRSGGDVSAAITEMTAHGYTESDVIKELKSTVGQWYRDDSEETVPLTDTEAVALLESIGISPEDAAKAVNEWSCYVNEGFNLDELKQQYLDGNITAEEAIRIKMQYAGKDKESAEKDVYSWASSDTKDAFENGEISQGEAVKQLVAAGKDKDAAEDLVGKWAYAQNYPEFYELDMPYAKVQTYEDAVAPTGVTQKQYADFYAFHEAQSDDYKTPCLAYINALPMTTAQKDALYLVYWAESRLSEAPWH